MVEIRMCSTVAIPILAGESMGFVAAVAAVQANGRTGWRALMR